MSVRFARVAAQLRAEPAHVSPIFYRSVVKVAHGGVIVVGERPRPARRSGRRKRLLTRAAPIGGIAAFAFAVGVVAATAPARAERHLVTRYVSAWAKGDYPRMYSMLDSASRARTSEAQFAAAYRAAATTATIVAIVPGHVGKRVGTAIPVRVGVRTRLFGTLHEILEVPLAGSGSSASVRFSSELLFPGLHAGEHLHRHTSLPPRAAILASDGTPLARGPDRTSPIPDVAGQIAGTLGPIPPADRTGFAARGYPPGAKVGANGLERVFQDRLAGTPGGRLLAGRRVLARSTAVPGSDVTSTINPAVERAAVAAMGGRYAGIAAMDPRTGGLLALAGVAFSALQHPGSTMKIITATGALEAGIVKLSDTFPIETSANVGGFILSNANGEACGGTFLNAFAVSCNSVFAPLGVKLGGARLVDVAERFGFNQAPSIAGAAESTIPSAATIGNATDVGSSAIGQGRVQSTALEMADVGATIAMGGRRPIPTLLAHQRPHFVRVTSRRIAGLVQQMMVAVVDFGTGTSAQITGVKVAGKTGTAELRNTNDPNNPNANSPKNTDAWFVGYAPVGAPRVVVGALFPEQGAGGDTAAPAVHDVLVAALQAH
jgi:Penicillin binding protein transpeptidase domain/Penicillin-binding Protein dimerisation domain/NTF2-like N-terminal transpeptidase domain